MRKYAIVLLIISSICLNKSFSQKYYIVLPNDINSTNYSLQIENIIKIISIKSAKLNNVYFYRADIDKTVKYKLKSDKGIDYKNEIFTNTFTPKMSNKSIDEIYKDISEKYKVTNGEDKYKEIHYSSNSRDVFYLSFNQLKIKFENLWTSISGKPKKNVFYFYIHMNKCPLELLRPLIKYPTNDFDAIPYDHEKNTIHFCWEIVEGANGYDIEFYDYNSPDKVLDRKSLNLIDYKNLLIDCNNKNIIEYYYPVPLDQVTNWMKNNGRYLIKIRAVCNDNKSEWAERDFIYWHCGYSFTWNKNNCTYDIFR